MAGYHKDYSVCVCVCEAKPVIYLFNIQKMMGNLKVE